MSTARARITKTPGDQGGEACLAGTRIPVWVLFRYHQARLTDAEVLEHYPEQTVEDLQAAWQYAREHRAEIDDVTRRNEEGDEGFVE
jgi:uncharacterized protein (DUF433 family)